MSKDVSKYFTKPDMQSSKKRTKLDVNTVYANLDIDDMIKNVGKNKKYFIRTYGCQMNVHDTEIMAGILIDLGYTEADVVEDADLVIFNTCAIRENAEMKVFGEIGRLAPLKQENPDKIFAVCGCMSQEEGVVNRLLEKHTQIDMIFGTHNIHRLPQLLKEAIFSKEKVVEVWSHEGEIIEALPKVRASKVKAWVNIIYGCDKFCTYCIVPFTRGKERSRNSQDIIDEVLDLVANGYSEVTLLGQNVNAYGKDLGKDYTMSNLLEDVANTGIKRIRFTTSHPWDFDDAMIEVIKKYDNIMPHIHLPVQAGNNEILKIMGRSYTRESYITLFDKLRAAKPDMEITTDIIVGYPNETHEQFLDTITLYEYCKFDGAFTFIYSPREGTPAAKMEDNVDMQTKKDRLQALNAIVNATAKESYEKMMGRTLEVLVEGVSTKNDHIMAGYSGHNKLVLFEGGSELIGKIVKVKITNPRNTALIGELID
jgi:tRNA-2-methylthio-N6-dimethylallyladenosine synthase